MRAPVAPGAGGSSSPPHRRTGPLPADPHAAAAIRPSVSWILLTIAVLDDRTCIGDLIEDRSPPSRCRSRSPCSAIVAGQVVEQPQAIVRHHVDDRCRTRTRRSRWRPRSGPSSRETSADASGRRRFAPADRAPCTSPASTSLRASVSSWCQVKSTSRSSPPGGVVTADRPPAPGR